MNRVRSSPISASRRAAGSSPRPGKLVKMTDASVCFSAPWYFCLGGFHDAPATRDAAETSVSSQLRYVHTTTDAERRRLERRTVATSAGFLVPYLRSGMRLLDCGCGPGSITVGLAEVVAPGETIGYDIERDRQRGYTVTPSGIVVVEGVRSRVEIARLQV